MKNRELLDRENRRLREINDVLIASWESLLRLTPDVFALEEQAPATFAKVHASIAESKGRLQIEN